MNLKLVEGLVRLGDGVTSVYKRLSRASSEEKTKAGFENDEEVMSSIGIASIEEYVTMSIKDVPQGYKAVFNLSIYEQPMRVVSMYINDPREDAIITELYLQDGTQITEQRFSKNKTPIQFPTIPLPPNVIIKVKALTDLQYIFLVLKPVVILDSSEGLKESPRGDIEGVSTNPVEESATT